MDNGNNPISNIVLNRPWKCLEIKFLIDCCEYASPYKEGIEECFELVRMIVNQIYVFKI